MTPLHRQSWFLPVALLVIASTLLALLWVLRPAPAQKDLTPHPLPVEAVVVAQQDLTVPLHAQGNVAPHTDTTLISEVNGQVMSVSPDFLAGGFFRQGDVLLRIDDRHYKAAVKQAEADVARARSDLAEEKGRAAVAYEDWVRAGRPKHRSDESRDLALRKPQVAEAEARLASALATLEQRRGDLAHTVIRAPYDGLVREKQVDVGQYVTTGTPLGRTFAVDFAEIRLALPENRLSYIDLPDTFDDSERLHTPVTLRGTVGDRTVTWQGELTRTEAVLDPRSRVLYLVVRVPDPYGLNRSDTDTNDWHPLRMGSFVHVTIPGRTLPDLIPLPRNVLRAGNKIWVIDEADRLRERTVTTLNNDGDTLLVSDGLETGERVCLTPVGNVLPGTAVSVTDLHTQSPANVTHGDANAPSPSRDKQSP